LGSQISNEYGSLRFKNYKATRSAAFAASVPKFISEIGLVLGGSFIGLIQVLLKDARGVLVGLVLFIALASRMLPALLRIQNAILEINGSKGATLDFLQEFELSENGLKAFRTDTNKFHPDSLEFKNMGFSPEIRAENASLSYGTSGTFELSHVSLTVNPGDFIGIVGPSGGGKTTLVDMLAGIAHLNSGLVTISGISPNQAVIKWPNEIRYVPQDVHLIVGSLRMNLTWPDLESQVRDEDLIKVTEQVGLLTWINNLPNGLDTNVEYFGANMSGGQKQRIGIARALICNPHLLFLDEATSSLDSSTENLITSNVISRLQGVTRIVVAHRISTIRNAHRIIYVANGKIRAEGSFEQIREMVPDFEEQAIQAGF
jgi:ABC-type bacteriocin/lantibiotic exporter with double-glycine peptidase domain